MPSDAPAITAQGPYLAANSRRSSVMSADGAPACTRAIPVVRRAMRQPSGVRTNSSS